MNHGNTFETLATWEQTQYKTFRNWVNINLTSAKATVEKLESDFKNGIKLVQLIEILQKKSVGKWNKAPKMQMHELENLNIAITAIQKDNIKIVNIGSTDINEGNLKIILGLIWTLIQHYHISQLDFLDVPSSSSGNTSGNKKDEKSKDKNLGAKDKLLNMINEIVKPWGYVAKNFTTDFEDGRILQCLAHTREPKTIRDPTNFGKDKHANVKEAFESFDKLNIPRVMDIDDVVDKHDEKAMMTLLGYVLKEVANRKQQAFKPGDVSSQPQKQEDDEELLEESSNVHSSKKVESNTNTNTNNQVIGDVPKVKRDRHSLFTRFVEIGRVVLITYGEYEGKIAAILDVIDANSVIIQGTNGVPRQSIPLKRVQLTDIVVQFRRNPRPNTLAKAWNQAKVQEQWEQTAWAKNLDSRKRKAEMNDFDRFKAVVAHQKRSKLIRVKRRELAPNKKSKK